jgi:hypothetical protein
LFLITKGSFHFELTWTLGGLFLAADIKRTVMIFQSESKIADENLLESLSHSTVVILSLELQ